MKKILFVLICLCLGSFINAFFTKAHADEKVYCRVEVWPTYWQPGSECYMDKVMTGVRPGQIGCASVRVECQ